MPRYLFRGEHDLYPDTMSSLFRLSEQDGFTEDEINEVKDCIGDLTVEMALRMHLLPYVSGTPEGRRLLNELQSWLQHYEFPVGTVDLTADLRVAAFFAARNNVARRGRIYVFEAKNLPTGNPIIIMERSFARRARDQQAYGLRMWDDKKDLQNNSHFPCSRFEFAWSS